MFRTLSRFLNSKARRICTNTRYQPVLEQLEARLLLKTWFWDGKGATSSWDAAKNWTNADNTAFAVPQPEDTAIFDGQHDTHINKKCTVDNVSTVSQLTMAESWGGTITITLPATMYTKQFSQFAGTIDGSGDLEVSFIGNWAGGTMSGKGSTSFAYVKIGGVGQGPIINREVKLGTHGGLLIQVGNITIQKNGILKNYGELLANSAASINGAEGDNDKIVNYKEWDISGSPYTINEYFTNLGTVNVAEKAVVGLSDGFSKAATFNVEASSRLTFSGGARFPYEWAAGTSFPGAGLVVVAGNVKITGAIQHTNLSFVSGSITNAAVLELSKKFTWTGGSIIGGTTVLDKGAVANLGGSLTLDAVTFSNSGGTTNLWAGTLQFKNKTAFTNSSGDFNIEPFLFARIVGDGTFLNNANFTKPVWATGLTQVDVSYTDAGLTTQKSLVPLVFTNMKPVTGKVSLDPATIEVDAWPLDLEGGTLFGAGDVQGTVANNGYVTPGDANGTGYLDVSGSYSQVAGEADFKIGGTTPKTLFDQINVTGPGLLNGTLKATLFGGFTPTNGNTFQVMTFGALAGTFSTVNLPPGFSIQYNYTATPPNVTLTYGTTSSTVPTVTGLSPATGTTAGGTSVTITGTNFTNVNTVLFGSYPAQSIVVNSATSITAVSPAEASGTVDVRVTTTGGQSATSASDQFVYTAAAVPTVTGVSATSGYTVGGDSVTITGTNFTGATQVKFGSILATSFSVTSATSITATAPAEVAATVDVTVVTYAGTSSTGSLDHYTYNTPPVPVVSSLGTSTGSTGGGTSVAITGTGFTTATIVFFGSVPAASFTINSSTSITAVSPPNATGTFDVTVDDPSGVSALSSSDQFTYTLASSPTITSLGTSTGTTAGGTSVTITGTNLTGALGVMFGNTPAASYTITSSTSITAISPPLAAGTYDITVVTFSGSSATSGSDQFTVTNASAPTVTAISQTVELTGGGDTITLTGTNFTGATTVTFGTVATTNFTVVSATSISVVVPAQAAATVHITVTTFAATSSTSSADQITYVNAPAPTVSAVSPSSGSTLGGTLVTITGSHFTAVTGVSFGSTAALSFIVDSDQSIEATAPALAAGTVDITVTTYSATSSTSSADHFTASAPSAPAITSISPTSGSTGGGTDVTISGSGFTLATDVEFGFTPAFDFTVVSDSLMTAIAPASNAGVWDITVTTPAGTSALGSADRYTYSAATGPAVSSLGTTSGSTAGGTVVTVTGTNFTGASAVYFGTVAAAFIVLSDTSIVATAPPEAAATVDVTVATPSGISAIGTSDHFTYNAASAPTVTAVSPSTGTSAGGVAVTITGTNLTGASGVSFGTVAAASFNVLSATTIVAFSPPEAAATVDVTVTTPSGTSATGSADHFTVSAASAPSVTGLSTTSGTQTGGTTIVVTGSGFTGASAVNFGSIAAVAFVVNSDTSITAVAPIAQATGSVHVTVTTPSGTSSTGSADQYTYSYVSGSAPTVTAVSPTTGYSGGGMIVVVSGTGFTGASAVKFGTTSASTFTVVSDSGISVTVPAGSVGSVDVTVTTPSGTSATGSPDHFTYETSAAPAISSLGTSTGTTAGGTQVTITGTSFTGTTAVYFGGVAGTNMLVMGSTTINITSPPEAAGTVDMTVVTPSGTSTIVSADHFTYTNATVPSITSNTGGSTVLIGGTVGVSGSHFTGATGVLVGGVPAAFSVGSDTSLSLTAPAIGAGSYDITVASYSGTSALVSGDRLTYSTGSAASITSLGTSSGSSDGGTSVTITGTTFTGVAGVYFGGVPAASYTVNSSTSITATSPPMPASTVDVVVATATGTNAAVSADHFTYSAASAPTVTAVSPSSGSTAGGTSVAITGTELTAVSSVLFGTVAAQSFVINSSTSITAVAPPEAAGTVDITVTSPSGTSSKPRRHDNAHLQPQSGRVWDAGDVHRDDQLDRARNAERDGCVRGRHDRAGHGNTGHVGRLRHRHAYDFGTFGRQPHHRGALLRRRRLRRELRDAA